MNRILAVLCKEALAWGRHGKQLALRFGSRLQPEAAAVPSPNSPIGSISGPYVALSMLSDQRETTAGGHQRPLP